MNFIKQLTVSIFSLCIGISCNVDESDDAGSAILENYTYYIDAIEGDDSNNGLMENSALKTLHAVNYKKLFAGDKILLKCGQTHKGMITLYGVDSVSVSSYDSGDKPIIDAKGEIAGVHIISSNNIVVENLEITANGPDGEPMESDPEILAREMRCGVLVETVKSGNWRGITLRNLDIHDVFFYPEGWVRPSDEKESENAQEGNNYGNGIIVSNHYEGGLAYLHDITIEGCDVRHVSHTGIKCSSANKTSAPDESPNKIYNVKVEKCNVFEVGAPGMQFGQVVGGMVSESTVNGAGSDVDVDSRNQCRGSGMWTFACTDFIAQHNRFLNSKGRADSSGAHIDFNCRNVVYQYNLSMNNAGGFVEILGNNHNCAYRYNVSINDGWRIKGGDVGSAENVAQWGYTLWVSNWSMESIGPFNSYIYNNSIYVADGNPSRNTFACTLEGICIVNNIFHIEGTPTAIKDRYPFNKAPQKGEVIFKNNLWLHDSAWAKDSVIKDSEPKYGDIGYANKGGDQIEDYIPSNISFAGIEIPRIAGDDFGLLGGLIMSEDILGNPVTEPHMGAIAYTTK